jgi:hypothetical protein
LVEIVIKWKGNSTPEIGFAVGLVKSREPFVMMDVYGFEHEDLEAARAAIEKVLSVRLDEAHEQLPVGRHYRICLPSDTCVQIHRNSGEFKWSPPWHPNYKLLIFVHGKDRESIGRRLCSVPGLLFLESKAMMDYHPSQFQGLRGNHGT